MKNETLTLIELILKMKEGFSLKDKIVLITIPEFQPYNKLAVDTMYATWDSYLNDEILEETFFKTLKILNDFVPKIVINY